jgi:hypothetical protein
MLGLAVLFFVGLYLLITLAAVLFAARWARKRGRRAWVWGAVAAFVMYNLVFWDLIPTLLIHKYYCATEAGFWVYKTPEQWVQENPGVLESLRNYDRSVITQIDSTRRYQFNERLRLEVGQEEEVHAIGRTEHLVRDISTGEVLIREVHFSLGWGAASVVSGGGLEGIRRAFAFGWLPGDCQRCKLPIDPEKQFWNLENSFSSIGERK